MVNEIITALEKCIADKQTAIDAIQNEIDDHSRTINKLSSDFSALSEGLSKLQYVLKTVLEIEAKLEKNKPIETKLNREEVLEIIPTKESKDSFNYEKIDGYNVAILDDSLIVCVGVSKYRTTKAKVLSLPEEINKNTLGGGWSNAAIDAVRTIRNFLKRENILT